MMEIVFSAADAATLLAEAVRLGYTAKDFLGNDHILTTGPVTGGGTYFLNVVGVVWQPTGGTISGRFGTVPEMAALPGVWGRLRVNGDPSHLPQFSAAIMQYYLTPEGFWSVDGVTPAPDYIANIGLIL